MKIKVRFLIVVYPEWERFVEWLRGVWEKVKSGFARKKAEQ